MLPESGDPRVLTAAEELTAKGLAHIVLLGQPDAVRHEAKRLNINISKVLASYTILYIVTSVKLTLIAIPSIIYMYI